MWPRVVELMLGLWLAMSPFILRSDLDAFTTWNAFWCSLLVVTASCLSYWPRTQHARAVTAAVSLWLIGYAYVAAGFPAAPALQNQFLVGLLLLMFAIIPNEAGQPPVPWRRFVEKSEARS